VNVNLPQDPELRELYLATDLQLAVEAFKKTTVGQYLLVRAAKDSTGRTGGRGAADDGHA
jgi:hypothetical protein